MRGDPGSAASAASSTESLEGFLGRASRGLAEAAEPRNAIASVALLAVEVLVDWMSVDMVDDAGAPAEPVVASGPAGDQARAAGHTMVVPLRARGRDFGELE